MTGDATTTGGRILVVDDEPSIRDLVRLTLEHAGHDVVTASTGREALEILRHSAVDAVLLDRTMPGMDGLDVVRAIRADPATRLLPVIMVTGLDATEARVEGLRLGADDYVVKPFEPEEVVARVEAQLRGHRAWLDRLTEAVDLRRTVLAAAARRAALVTGVEASASALCHEFHLHPDVDGVVLVEVARDRTSTVAAAGVDGMELLGMLDAKAEIRAIRLGLADGPTSVTLADRLVVGVPIATRDETLGVLVLTGSAAGPKDQLLALAIDFAALTLGVLAEPMRASLLRTSARADLTDIVDLGAFRPVFQAVVDLVSGETVGYEALTRFEGSLETERLFVDAARLGMGLELERATLRAAIDAAAAMPADRWLAVNVTPSMILQTDELAEVLADHGRHPVVLEISELEPVLDYDALLLAVQKLDVIVQLSVDDAGSGFASLAHILALGADYVKLDKSWVDGIESDPAKRALVAGLQNFADETGASLIAEGIETEEQRAAVRRLGIRYGQGYLLGRPVRFPVATD